MKYIDMNKYMKNSCLSLAFVLVGWTAFAQQGVVSGQVIDASSNEPLIGAYVSVEGESAFRAVTDEDGWFMFQAVPYGTYQLRITYLGMAPWNETFELDNTAYEIKLELSPNSATLTTVVVNGESERFSLRRLRAVEGTAIYAGRKSEVIELKDIAANLAANNPRQVYSKVAGLNIWESDGAGLQLGIGGRGLSPNRTSNFNTRQNGYDISADALGYPESYYTPPAEALSRIEVVRGAASLQYGTQFGGMLNFVFKRPEADRKFSLSTRQSVGSYGFFNSFNSISGTVAKGKLGYYGYFQYKRGDGWRPNSGFELTNGYLALEYQVNDKLRLGGQITNMHYLAQQAGGLTDTQFDQDPRQSFRERNWFQVNWNLLAFTLDQRFSDRTRLNIRAFGLAAERLALGNLAPINVVDFGDNRDLIKGRFRNYGLEARLLHRYNFRNQVNTFLIGARWYRGQTNALQGEANDGSGPDFYFLNPENVEKSDYVFPNRNLALFAEHIFSLDSHWTLTPGIRFEYINTRSEGYYRQRIYDGAGNLIVDSRFEDEQQRRRRFVILGLGASYKPSDQWEVYANVSQNYRAINFSDLRIDNPNARVDPEITDEEGYTADLGLRKQTSDGWYFDLTAFYIAYRDRIGWVLRSNEPPLYNDYRFRTNIADARNIGLETFVEANLWYWLRPEDRSTKLSVYVNAAVIDAKYINTDDRSIAGNEVELVPPFTFRTGLQFNRDAFRLGASWSYTARHYSDATNAERTASAVNGLIPSYSVADVSAAYQWKSLSLEVSCNNALNASYFTRRAEAYPGPGIIPADGRAFFVTIGWQY